MPQIHWSKQLCATQANTFYYQGPTIHSFKNRIFPDLDLISMNFFMNEGSKVNKRYWGSNKMAPFHPLLVLDHSNNFKI